MGKKMRLRLNKYMDAHSISRYALSQSSKVGYPIIDRYYKNQIVRYDSDVLNRIITALDCSIEDIFEIYECEENSAASE